MQDSDWEEVEADDVELDKDLMYSAGVTSSGRPSHQHLEAIAKAFNKVLCCYLYIIEIPRDNLPNLACSERMRRRIGMKMIN